MKRRAIIKEPVRGPLAGMFTAPCGVWVSVDKFASGMVWGRVLHTITRRNVLGPAQ